jgi:hypothetical protein
MNLAEALSHIKFIKILKILKILKICKTLIISIVIKIFKIMYLGYFMMTVDGDITKNDELKNYCTCSTRSGGTLTVVEPIVHSLRRREYIVFVL